jgi:hypothetical protein
MIRFTVSSGMLVPVLSNTATTTETETADEIARNLNAVTKGSTNYKQTLEALDGKLAKTDPGYRQYIDEQTISEIENFYQTAKGIQPWNAKTQGANLDSIDFNFYKKIVPEVVTNYTNATQSVGFAGRKIADIDVTKQYPDLNSYLHANYTFVGAPSGLPGKPKQFTEYTETLRAPTDKERQILRETLLGRTQEKPDSLADLAAQNFVDVQGERAFSALSADVLKQTLNEYNQALKQQQMTGVLQGMGLPNVNNFKQDIKNAILGDMEGGGFLNLSEGLSKNLDKSLGIGSSVAYNWQKWFDETLAKRYQTMQEIKDPNDATKTYKLEQQFVTNFINDYLKPRFDTSKSISEFVSYMDVKEDEQNVLQTQLASSALKEFANKQATAYINALGQQTVTRGFDSDFYWNPSFVTGTRNQQKQNLYAEQKSNVEADWNQRNNNVAVKDGKTWSQLAYEYGSDLNNKNDFARLHYEIIGKNKGYDPVADTYNRQDLARFIQGDLSKALESQKASFGNPTFLKFVSANSKATELVDKLNIANLPAELQGKLKELGINEQTDPAESVKQALTQILSTDPALEIRENIRQLNEANIKPTQENLGYGYIQREEDEKIISRPGGSQLYQIFKKAGYGGNENEFYTEFFPDATEEDKNLTASTIGRASTKEGLQSVMGFNFGAIDFSDPFAAIGSLSSMLEEDNTSKKETYVPKRSSYFSYFEDEEDEGAPSYFNMSTKGGFGSLFG